MKCLDLFIKVKRLFKASEYDVSEQTWFKVIIKYGENYVKRTLLSLSKGGTGLELELAKSLLPLHKD